MLKLTLAGWIIIFILSTRILILFTISSALEACLSGVDGKNLNLLLSLLYYAEKLPFVLNMRLLKLFYRDK